MRTMKSSFAVALLATAVGGCQAGHDLVRSAEQGIDSLFAPDQPLYLEMTQADVKLANAALDRALESNASGTAASWRNRASGNHGQVTPLRSFRRGDGVYCRDYRETVVVGGDSEAWTDTACREGAAYWQPVN